VRNSDAISRKNAGSASRFLHQQLLKTGLLDPAKRVIDEPFSRDIRGCAPNNKDIYLSQVCVGDRLGRLCVMGLLLLWGILIIMWLGSCTESVRYVLRRGQCSYANSEFWSCKQVFFIPSL
jgi:hypothetical protein